MVEIYFLSENFKVVLFHLIFNLVFILNTFNLFFIIFSSKVFCLLWLIVEFILNLNGCHFIKCVILVIHTILYCKSSNWRSSFRFSFRVEVVKHVFSKLVHASLIRWWWLFEFILKIIVEADHTVIFFDKIEIRCFIKKFFDLAETIVILFLCT